MEQGGEEGWRAEQSQVHHRVWSPATTYLKDPEAAMESYGRDILNKLKVYSKCELLV